MAKQNKNTLKGYFETGDIPNQSQYQELIDSNLNLQETGTQILVGTLSSSFLEVESDITASGNISASGTIIGNKIETGTLFSSAGDANTGLQFGSDTVFIEGNDVNLAKFNATRIELNSPITASGNISASGDIIANSLNISNLITQNITASGDISANAVRAGGLSVTGDIIATDIIVLDDIILADNSRIVSSNQPDTFILLNNDDYWRINANNINVAQFTSVGVIFNEDSAASCDFRVESNNDTHTFFIDSSTDKVGIGTPTPTEKLTVQGNISGSGNLKIDGSQVDFTNLPTSDPGVTGRLYNDSGTVKISG